MATFEGLGWDGSSPKDYPYVERSGRAVYDEKTIAGYNQLPVDENTAYIIRGAKGNLAALPVGISLADQAKAYQLDGGIVAVNIANIGWELQTYLVECTPRRVVQDYTTKLRADHVESVTQVWRLFELQADGSWLASEIRNYGTPSAVTQGEPVVIPKGAMICVPNEMNPSGILEPAQRKFHRIEEIYRALQGNMNPSTVSTILSGLVANIQKAINNLNRGSRFVGIPGNIQVHKVGDSGIGAQLLAELEQLIPDYFRMMKVSATIDSLERVSGVAVALTLTPQMEFIEQAREKLIEACRLFNVTVRFPRLVTDSAEQREIKLRNLIAASDRLTLIGNPLTPEEEGELIRELL